MASPDASDARLYQLLVEQTGDYAVFVLDPNGDVRTWNLGAERLKGYRPDEIVGRHFSLFYPQDAIERGWPQHELKVAAAEGRFEDEGWRVRKDGSRFWANVTITALRDESGKLIGFSKITRDLTDRRLHEEALRQSEERFRLMIESVRDYAIYMLDPQGMITSWNSGAQRIKGYAREEVVDHHFSRFYEQADIDAGKPWEDLAIARREGRVEREAWRVRKNGERFWARIVLTSVYDATGQLRGFAKVTQDLSERRHAQDLEKASRNVTEFLAVLAHELRNPLAPIRTATAVMAKAPPGDTVHDAMRETIERQARQLSRIVDDLLDISRITRGKLHVKREPLDLAEVARVATETAAPWIEAARHHLQVDVAGDLVVRGDAQRLTQAVANLLNNAARYTPPGGSIALQARAEGGRAVVRVRDTGRGIEAPMLERIFDMFVQGRDVLERVGGGLGIGLALARRIAELHGGKLEAKSEGEGRGAEFILELPLAEGVVPHAAPPPAAPAAAPGAKRVLVVDDNVDAALTLALLLRSLGHETEVVHDGAAALRAAASFRPDVVLLDIGMPGMDGYEVARRLHAARRERPLRIVAITGWGADADRQRTKEAGFDTHLVKPVDALVIERVLQERDGHSGSTLH